MALGPRDLSQERDSCQTIANSQNYNNFHSKLAKVVTLTENSGQFVTLLSFDKLFSSQLEINHVIQEPTTLS